MAVNYGSKRIVVGAHYGLRDWLAQRITAVLMLLFTLALVVQLLMPGALSFVSAGWRLRTLLGPCVSVVVWHAGLRVGTYRLVFDVAAYFKARGVKLPEPNFLNRVILDFGVAHADQHYHVPLLVSPWSYSTYRGS